MRDGCDSTRVHLQHAQRPLEGTSEAHTLKRRNSLVEPVAMFCARTVAWPGLEMRTGVRKWDSDWGGRRLADIAAIEAISNLSAPASTKRPTSSSSADHATCYAAPKKKMSAGPESES